MTIRRSERDWNGYADIVSFDENENAIPSVFQQFSGPDDDLRRDVIGNIVSNIHPAITNYGPESLVHFLRSEIESAVLSVCSIKAHGKGKENAGMRSYYNDIELKSAALTASTYDAESSLVERDLQVQRGSLQLVPDALIHQRGLKSSKGSSANVLSCSGLSSSNGLVSAIETHHQVSAGRRPLHSSAPQTKIPATSARSDDFARHTQKARNRTRPAQAQSSVQSVVTKSVGGSVDGLADMPSINPFTAPEFTSSGFAQSIASRRLGKFEDATFYGSDDSTIRSFTLRGYPTRKLIETLPDSDTEPSNSSIIEDENADELPGRLQSLTTDSDRDDLSSNDAGPADKCDHYRKVGAMSGGIKMFDYSRIVPSDEPRLAMVTEKAEGKKKSTPSGTPSLVALLRREDSLRRRPYFFGSQADPEILSSTSDQSEKTVSEPLWRFIITNDIKTRKWKAHYPPISRKAPPICSPDASGPARNAKNDSNKTALPYGYDVWSDVLKYLSFQDLRNLRLSCRGFAEEIAPSMFRNVVATFGKSMFNTSPIQRKSQKDPSLEPSMFSEYGGLIRKFGISFEYDPIGLAYAKRKVTQVVEHAWFGNYPWPVKNYPRYPELQQLEELVDSTQPLLKDSLAYLTRVSELALSLDSGHGWLNGPDISDLQLYERRRKQGPTVFGESFPVEDTWHAFGRSELFRWAQQNTINAGLQTVGSKGVNPRNAKQCFDDLKNMVVRDHDSFRAERFQPDFDPFSHTGGQTLQSPPHQPQLQAPAGPHAMVQLFNPAAVAPLHALHFPPTAQPGNAFGQPQMLPNPFHNLRSSTLRQRIDDSEGLPKNPCASRKIEMQWPIIFNGYNLAAEAGGLFNLVQKQVADPAKFPLIPGCLTEAQAQWLMETVWAQRAFLSNLTTSVIDSKLALAKVHTLTIAKLSSGLLSSLAQKEFWSALAGLKRLKILISPDWRDEHVEGDKYFAVHMTQSPLLAATKFAEFLRLHIVTLEHLSHLTVGYVGGGEHATGMFARNQHVLPAPITEVPSIWITDHVKKPDLSTLIKFDHIRDLAFENCWFSPCMLESFMDKSHDSSLHALTLNSVSMLARHSTGIDGSLQTVRNGLRCRFDEIDWLYEEIPASAAWTGVLDKITPGITMVERKYAANLMRDGEGPPTREYRGHVQKIVLKSCGYAKISGVKGDEFNQNSLVIPSYNPMDKGLHARRRALERWVGEPVSSHGNGERILERHARQAGSTLPQSAFRRNRLFARDQARDGSDDDFDDEERERQRLKEKEGPIMMNMKDPDTGEEWFGLGVLTQCVHPIEKRILEQAWGFCFGWGDDIRRWSAVEDGFFEGGTGRFSGEIRREDSKKAT